MMLKACIFDLDGVIVDTAAYHYQAWNRLAKDLGFDFTHLQNEQLKGISRMDSLQLVLQWGNVEKTEAEKIELAGLKNSWYVARINQMTSAEILPGVADFFNLVKKAGLKIGLGSASKNSSIILQRTGLIDFFDVIVDGNHVSKSKPDPQVFLKCAERLGMTPSECIVFEDAVAGIEAAHRAGMKAIGIGKAEILENAELVIPDLSTLSIEDLIKIHGRPN